MEQRSFGEWIKFDRIEYATMELGSSDRITDSFGINSFRGSG